ncbi:hypothetical protein [Pseudoalteromonas nigrifaciens]|uniref:hypothetical protein n=1 Tax=Pseudoalteromonas nigrifaciens TaxID=28109 RepID=UPI0017889F88|nr:hypothetical protein [Pseudoalteromonas nigrifaciens]MBE0421989.1 hypothetical protein [Pseudoalteromonas nigrifaciens]
MITDEFRDDIKTLFDFLRNLGICFVILLSIPGLEKSAPSFLDCFYMKQILMYFTFGIFVALYGLNNVWLFKSLKVKPGHKYKSVSFISSVIMTIIFTISITGFSVINVWAVLMKA